MSHSIVTAFRCFLILESESSNKTIEALYVPLNTIHITPSCLAQGCGNHKHIVNMGISKGKAEEITGIKMKGLSKVNCKVVKL